MGYQESNKHLINICCLPDSKSCLGYALYLPLLQSRCSNEFLFFNEGKHSCNSCILVAQSCPTLLDLMDCSPPGSCPWNSPDKNIGVGSHSLLQGFIVAVVQVPSHVRLLATPWTAACQASLSLTISQSFPKFMSIASVMPSSHLIL